MKLSLNGNLILKPYTKTKELKQTQVVTGLAIMANKVGVEPLELLVDTVVTIGDTNVELPKGSKIYFTEEMLTVQQWPRKIFESEGFEGGFVVGNIREALFIEKEG